MDISPTTISRTHEDLVEQIKQLEADRQKHAAALAVIDQVLGRIDEVIKNLHLGSRSDPKQAELAANPGVERTASGRARRYRKLSLTGAKSILAFVSQRHGATTAEINAHWRTEGRGGLANNTIGHLLRRGELVRQVTPGHRGSHYECHVECHGQANAQGDAQGNVQGHVQGNVTSGAYESPTPRSQTAGRPTPTSPTSSSLPV